MDPLTLARGAGVADWIATSALLLALGALARIDLRERRLPDRITLPLAAAGLLLAAWRTGGWPVAEMWGAGMGFALFWVLGEAHLRLRGAEGLGLGDAKLLGAAGAWLGWRDLPLLVLVAAVAALAGQAVTVARRTPRRRDVAFGPWLALAFMVLWVLHLAGGG